MFDASRARAGEVISCSKSSAKVGVKSLVASSSVSACASLPLLRGFASSAGVETVRAWDPLVLDRVRDDSLVAEGVRTRGCVGDTTDPNANCTEPPPLRVRLRLVLLRSRGLAVAEDEAAEDEEEAAGAVELNAARVWLGDAAPAAVAAITTDPALADARCKAEAGRMAGEGTPAAGMCAVLAAREGAAVEAAAAAELDGECMAAALLFCLQSDSATVSWLSLAPPRQSSQWSGSTNPCRPIARALSIQRSCSHAPRRAACAQTVVWSFYRARPRVCSTQGVPEFGEGGAARARPLQPMQ